MLANTFEISDQQSINGINFTERELDILACIISGRSAKKIANFLEISYRTVEVHLRNIRSKLGCYSKEEIIDYIEKSKQFHLIKDHYTALLAKMAFEHELNKIAKINPKLPVIIVTDKTAANKKASGLLITEHLKNTGFNINNVIWENQKSLPALKNLNSETVPSLIYVLNNATAEKLAQHHINLADEFNALYDHENLSKLKIILLIVEKIDLKLETLNANVSVINYNTYPNYYELFFACLTKLLAPIDITINIKAYNDRISALIKDQSPKALTELQNLPNTIKNNIKQPQKIPLKWLALIISPICFGSAIYKINTEIKSLKQQSSHLEAKVSNIDPEQPLVKSITQKVILFNLPQRNLNFTGRENTLTYIKEQLSKQKVGAAVQVIAGLGGVGKTQLAAEFAYKAVESQIYQAVFYITAETNAALHNAYKECAKSLQIDIRGLSPNKVQDLVHHTLIELHPNSKILIILDDVTNHEKIQEYLDKLYKQCNNMNAPLHILITSRSQHWSMPLLILDIFTEQEAIRLINKILPMETPNAALKLAKTLYYFPLAIGQATAYIKAHTNIKEYLTLYSNKKYEYLNKFSGDKNQHTESLWKTWHISLSKLSTNAKEIIAIASYLDPDYIPFSFFDAFSLEEKSNAIEELRKYSFIIPSHNNQAFTMHRLLQDIIKLTNSTKINNNQPLLKAIDILLKKFNFNYAKPETWSECGEYLTNAQIIAKHIANSGEDHKFINISMQLYMLSATYFLNIRDDYETAEKILYRILHLTEKHYTHDKSANLIKASVYSSIARVSRYVDAIEKAKSYALKAHKIYKTQNHEVSAEVEKLLVCLRADPKITAENGINYDHGHTLSLLGLIYQNLADFKKAELFHSKAFAKFNGSSVKPSNNASGSINLLWLLGAAGFSYTYSGNIEQAKIVLEEARIIADRDFSEHLERAWTYEYNAGLQYYLGEYKQAKNSINTSLGIRRAIQSKDNLRIGYDNALLGLIMCATNNISEGIAYLKETEKLYLKTFKKNHFRLIYHYLYLSHALELNQEYEQAIKYLRKAKQLAISHWGDKVNVALAHYLSPTEKFPTLLNATRDISYYLQGLNLTKQLFGADHIRTARYHYILGQAYEKNNNKNLAYKHYKQALILAKSHTFPKFSMQKKHQENLQAIENKLTTCC